MSSSNSRRKCPASRYGCTFMTNTTNKRGYSTHVTNCPFFARIQTEQSLRYRNNSSIAQPPIVNKNEQVSFRTVRARLEANDDTANNIHSFETHDNALNQQYQLQQQQIAAPLAATASTTAETQDTTAGDNDMGRNDDDDDDDDDDDVDADDDYDYDNSYNDQQDIFAFEDEYELLEMEEVVDDNDDAQQEVNVVGSTEASNRNDHIRFNATIAPPHQKGLTLMDVLDKHNTNLKLYDDIVNFINTAAQSGYDFKLNPLPRRTELLRTCEATFNLKRLKPSNVSVAVKSVTSGTVNVPIFDARAVLQKMLCDPQLMQEKNIAKGLDPWTGLPKDDGVGNDNEEYYDEIHSGDRWLPARNDYCGDDTNILPCGLILFIDKSHFDSKGALKLSPLMMTLSFFNKECRSKKQFWSLLAYIPELLTSPTLKQTAKSLRLTEAEVKCQDEHHMIYQALKQLKDINDSDFRLTVMGREVRVKAWIHLIVGDIAGNNVLTGSFNSSICRCPYRDCDCEFNDILNSDHNCNMWTRAQLNAAKVAARSGNSDALRAMSKYNIDNAFDNLPMGDPINGIMRATPPETMHAIQSGIMMYIIQTIFKSFITSETAKNEFHLLHLYLANRHGQQSERGLPIVSVRNSVADVTKMSATETMGNLYLIMCALYTNRGKQICNDCGVSDNHRKKQILCIQQTLALYALMNRRNRKVMIKCDGVGTPKQLKYFIKKKYIPFLQECFPRNEGNGWSIPKLHSLEHFTFYISQFGCARNFFGGIGESHLKDFLKYLGHLTQRRQGLFAVQVAQQYYHRLVFQHSVAAMNRSNTKEYHEIRGDTSSSLWSRNFGKHTIAFAARTMNRHLDHTRVSYEVNWHTSKGSAQKQVDASLVYVVSKAITNSGFYEKFEVCAYTSLTIRNRPERVEEHESIADDGTIYRAEGSTIGGRNDWCMIAAQQLNTDESTAQGFNKWHHTCPAKILGFVQFVTPGTPTPMLLLENSIETIRDCGMRDSTMYVVVRTHKDYMTWNELEKAFVLPIELGELDTCTYILPVERIMNPLYVFENVGQSDKTKLFVTLPQRYWALFLEYSLTLDDAPLIPGPSGLSQMNDAIDEP